MNKPRIEQYLVSICLLTIDEFNGLYGNYQKKDLKEEADMRFNEMDIAVRIGYPFKQSVRYTVGESVKTRKEQKINHDLFVKNKEFKIEVKYLKNWKSNAGTWSATKTWAEFQQDFDWLMDEIDSGNKGKSAFVIGWFNCVNSFSQLIQIGNGCGSHPMVNESRLCYFPFLTREKKPTRTTDLKYNYESFAYKEFTLNPIGNRTGIYNCMFLGSESDCFHFAIYY